MNRTAEIDVLCLDRPSMDMGRMAAIRIPTCTNPFIHLRRASSEKEALKVTTLTWARSLPMHVLPKSLLINFPRIANSLADAWANPRRTNALLQDLILSERPGRQGFPFEVVKELTELKIYSSRLYPENKKGW